MRRITLRGLVEERTRGKTRWRVRVATAHRKDPEKDERITVPDPDNTPDFLDHYHAARKGQRYQPKQNKTLMGSLDWLVAAYLAHLWREVEAKQKSPLTLRQRRSQLTRLTDFAPKGDRYGGYSMNAPSSAFVVYRDSLMATPAEADNAMKSIRAMYSWACERGTTAENPARNIAKIHRNRGGATAWTVADLRAYRAAHPAGSMARLALYVLLFTGCRIGDAIWLGRAQEVPDGTRVWLEWQPSKAGSAPVAIPILPPLLNEIRAQKVIGPAYILREDGQPFSSTEGLRNRFRKWCESANLAGKSPHGVRKGLASILSEEGMSDAQIGAILAHTNAQTTAVYTAARDRRIMAAAALSAVAGKLGDW